MELLFHLHWVRENGCDHGTPLRAEQLDDSVRDRVLDAAQGAEGPLTLRLPYLDKRELRRRPEMLGELQFRRRGSEIQPILPPRLLLRTTAAELGMTHPAWIATPSERDASYFRFWQYVSVALQRALRTWMSREYFRDVQTYQDREAAYSWIVYQAARIYRGSGPQDFTYDLRDFPECRDTLESTWSRIGTAICEVLCGAERRLYDAGLPALARRYSPRWHEDVLREVQRRPAEYHRLLAVETSLIDSIVELGTTHSPGAVSRFAKIVGLRYRNLGGRDLRMLAIDALNETTRILSDADTLQLRIRRSGPRPTDAPWQSGPVYESFQNNSASDLRT